MTIIAPVQNINYHDLTVVYRILIVYIFFLFYFFIIVTDNTFHKYRFFVTRL